MAKHATTPSTGRKGTIRIAFGDFMSSMFPKAASRAVPGRPSPARNIEQGSHSATPAPHEELVIR